MRSPVSISVFDFFKLSALHTREQAQKLFTAVIDLMESPEPVWVDFSDIEFISRSFADELVHLKVNSNDRSLINFCCASSNVNNMLETVERTQTNKSFEKKLPVHQFDSLESMRRFLSTI